MVLRRLQKLREKMKEKQLQAYIIPTADFHQSEYVGEYFGAREFMSGFTGSAGVLVVLEETAGLWTDGRYFIQAARQLEGSSITLFPQGEEGVLTVEEFLADELAEGDCIGFDGRVVSSSWGKKIEDAVSDKHVTICYEEDLVDGCWTDRPSLSKEAAFLLEERFAGESAESKVNRIRVEMEKEKATMHVVTSLDDIAWTLNIRGNDIAYNPVVLSYLVITMEEVILFVDEEKLNEDIMNSFGSLTVSVCPYDDVYEYLKGVSINHVVWMDGSRVNYKMSKCLAEEIQVISKVNPSILMKAMKNPTEIKNLTAAHVKDGVAVTKFMYWLKKNIGKRDITEIEASDYLEEQRKAQEGFVELSFNTICAYKDNAAMMHYSATLENQATLQPEGLLLVDSGGQYFEGTTDITRTFALGPVSEEQRGHFTAVVNGMLNLSCAKFLHGCTGMNLDILARGPIWNMDLDYKCGTGHGIGYLLNVHEAPNGFRWKVVPERNDGCVLEEGMVTTNEPGIYIEGSHGIRIENELVCRKGVKNEYGQFMYFDTITVAPIDLDALDLTKMSQIERGRLNAYHKHVYETIVPYMSIEEALWLKEYTREI